jgi:hypothetical protein
MDSVLLANLVNDSDPAQCFQSNLRLSLRSVALALLCSVHFSTFLEIAHSLHYYLQYGVHYTFPEDKEKAVLFYVTRFFQLISKGSPLPVTLKQGQNPVGNIVNSDEGISRRQCSSYTHIEGILFTMCGPIILVLYQDALQ